MTGLKLWKLGESGLTCMYQNGRYLYNIFQDDLFTRVKRDRIIKKAKVVQEGPLKNECVAVMGISNAKRLFKSGIKPKRARIKMDVNKALGIMNFSSTREFMDKSLGLDPKQELDKRHFKQTIAIMTQKEKERNSEVCFHFGIL